MTIRPKLTGYRCALAVALSAAWLAFSLDVRVPSSLAQEQVQGEIRAYAVRHRNADELAPQLRNMLAGQAGNALVSVDREGNRLLVQGFPPTQQLALQVIQALDKAVAPAIAPAAAPQVANPPVVRSYRVNGDLDRIAEQLRTRYPIDRGARIATDPRTQQLLVIAPPELQQRIAQELPGLAPQPAAASPALPSQPVVPRPGPPVATAPYQLKNVSWREFEDGLQQLLGGRIQAEAARNGEQVTVHLATSQGFQPVLQINRPANHVVFEPSAHAGAWRQLTLAIDTAKVTAPGELRMVPIRNADPNKVQTAVSLMRAAPGGEVTAVQTGGGRRRDHWNGQMLAKVFQENGQPLQPNQPAPPADAAPGVAPPDAVPDGAQEDEAAGGMLGPVQIEFLEGLDVIIIRGRKRDVERVQKLIAEIEAISKETQPIVEVHHLKHINNESAVTLVNELYQEILSARQGQVSIRALVEPNAILLIGRRESIDSVIELIDKLDQPATDAGNFVIIRLKYIAAITAEQTIRSFFVNRPGQDDTQRPGLGTQVKVIADYRTNSLIVQASPRDLGEIRRLVESIDAKESETSTEIRVFRLKNALALDLAEALLGAIRGEIGTTGQAQPQIPGQQPGGGGGTATQSQVLRPASTLEFKTVDPQNGRLIRSGIMDDVQVTADPNINALLVRAPAESMELIAALVKELDQLPDMEALIKVFTVVNSDATNLAGMLQTLFGQQVTAGQGNAQGIFGLTQPQAVQSAGEGSLVPLTFAVDVRTNSIIASGSSSDLAVVETLLLRLDEADIATRRLSVVRLKNAPALDVANSITTFLTSQRDLIQQQLLFNQAISPYEQIEREVIVVPEIVTNSLIVSATPAYYEEIMQVIRELDFRPPMVMVQVLIAEVRLDDAFEFGTELGLQDSLLFDRGSAGGTARTPGFNFLDENQFLTTGNPGLPNSDTSQGPGRLAGQALSSLGLGRSSALPGVGYGGLVLSAASESINLLVRALEQEGRLQVLSRPQIMALNNQEAFVQVGADVSRINGTTITNNTVQQNVNDVQTGLILRIQPLINDDGVIVMRIDAERSALGAVTDGTVIGTDQNGNPIVSPPINRTTAQTTISAKSGQTVVFAGLMTNTKSSVERQIPFIGDVPLLGNLFRFESNTTIKTELMIIMTPYIVADDEDYENLKMMESQRMTWCLGDVASVHGEVGLMSNGCLFCEDNVPVIFPDMDPLGVINHGGGHYHHHGDSEQKVEDFQPTPVEGTPIPVPPPVDQVDYRWSEYGPARRLPPPTPAEPALAEPTLADPTLADPTPGQFNGPPSPTVRRVGFQASPTVLPPWHTNVTSHPPANLADGMPAPARRRPVR